ncbi:MAG: hypothetical protein NT084_01875 [Bacteroidetes bacterium]|jgi:hypothetical protein|nr:hypothetical protein [Bacteroidota bacterium]
MKSKLFSNEFVVRKLFFLLITFFCFHVNGSAQWSDTIETILHGKVYPTASFDSRNSFISNSRAHIWGVKIGVDFSGKIQGGIGYNRHDKNLRKEIYFSDLAGNPDSASAFLHLDYFSFYMRYVYYNKGHWRFSVMPYQLGFGNSDYRYLQNGSEKISGKRFVVIYEPGISVSYKFFKWLGVGGDIGYRFMLRNNPNISENFNSPIYSFYVSIYWGELYKNIFPETKLAKML